MKRNIAVIIGIIISLALLGVYIFMVFFAKGKVEVGPVVEVLDAATFQTDLSQLSQKEKNADLPVEVPSDQLERDDPFSEY